MVIPLRSRIRSWLDVHNGLLRAYILQSSYSGRFLRPERNIRQTIMFTDLESDYINPIHLCEKLNWVRHHGESTTPTHVLLASPKCHRLVCASREWSTCVPDDTIPNYWSMDGLLAERAFGCI